MRTHAPDAAHEPAAPHVADSSRPRRYPVIADRGDAAWLVLLDGRSRPAVGTRFSFQGAIWEIITDRTPARTFVAERRCN